MHIDGEKVTASVEGDGDTFTAEEQAYMDGRGEVETPAEPAAPPANPAEAKAPPAEGDKLAEKEPEVEKLVKHGAFEEERQRRKKAERQAQLEREEAARLRGQLEALQAGQKPADLTPEEEADWDKNPIAAGKALQAKLDAQEKASKASEAVQSIISTGQQHCRKFAETEPQFFNTTGPDGKPQEGAYAFLRRATAEKIKAEQEANGQPVDQATIEQLVNYHEIRLINESLAMRMNPAAAMWHWAQIAGFKPRTAEAPKPPAPPAPPTEAEKIANLEKAQAGAKSLGSIPAGGGDASPTLKAIADMDDDEFAAATTGKNWEKLHRQGVI